MFHLMSNGPVKYYSANLYFIACQVLFGTMTSEHFKEQINSMCLCIRW